MKIHNQFTDKGFDIFEHKFFVDEHQFLLLDIYKAPFEHITVTFTNPKGKDVQILSFKTRFQKFKLVEDALCGEWTLTVIRTYPIHETRSKEYEINLTTAPLEKEADYQDYFSLVSAKTDTSLFTEEGFRYYQGDIHLHSSFSDGRMSMQDLADISRLSCFDFLAPTDHNLWMPLKTKIPLIPALEYTPDDFGHFNIYGIQENLPLKSIYEKTSNLTQALDLILQYVEENNLVISINHPFCRECCPSSRNFSLDRVHLIEVINSPHGDLDRLKNNDAVLAFDFLWTRGYPIFAVGGSDAHRAVVDGWVHPGNPLVRAYAENNSPLAVLNAIKYGRTYLSCRTDLSFKISCDGVNIVPGTETQGLIKWKGEARKELTWNLIKNGTIFKSSMGTSFDFCVPLEKGEYIRLEGRDEKNTIAVFFNPIYCQLNKQEGLSWYDVLECVGENPKAI